MPRSRRSPRRASGASLEADGRRRYSSGSPWEPKVGYVRALRVGDRVLVSGTTGVLPGGSLPRGAYRQTARALDIVDAALRALGSSRAAVVRLRVYVTDFGDFPAIARALSERFGSVRPTNTMVKVAGLVDPRMRVEVEAEAVDLPQRGRPGSTSSAPTRPRRPRPRRAPGRRRPS